MDQGPSTDLLADTHDFPCVYQFKAIGNLEAGFQSRVIDAVVAEVNSTGVVDSVVRETPGGRHVAVTLHVRVESPEQVRSIYARLKGLEGLLYLL